MRLLRTSSLTLEDFATPPKRYAILSHRWGQGEVSFQDLQGSDVVQNRGYQKIKAFCAQASKDGFEYGWVDTCCIDKTNSVELSEAINSMYRWYELAEVCYAYLSDAQTIETIERSEWFQRGWTLQELVAPKQLAFYSSEWRFLGSKISICDRLSRVTGIGKEILLGKREIGSATVAHRMSWAARRQTTREEDIAYCLMGIFDVNMPLLYGEGRKAFIRLQEAILLKSDDHSILAWGHPNYDVGPLATSPSAFRDCGNIVPYFQSRAEESSPWSMTNLGLRMELPIYIPEPMEKLYFPDACIGILNCSIEKDFSGPLGIRIRQISSRHKDQYSRLGVVEGLIDLELVSKATMRTVYIREDPPGTTASRPAFYIRKRPALVYGYSLQNVYPPTYFDETQMVIQKPCTTFALIFGSPFGSIFIVVVGRRWCRVVSEAEVPFTQGPAIEARELFRKFKSEIINRAQGSFSRSQGGAAELSPEMRQYVNRLMKNPEFGETAMSSWTPDYEALFLRSKVHSWDESDEHRLDIGNGMTIIAKVRNLDVMGEIMLVVDIEIVPFRSTAPSLVALEPLATVPGSANSVVKATTRYFSYEQPPNVPQERFELPG